MEKMFEKLLNPADIIERILPIEVTVKLRIYKAKDGSYCVQFLPIEDKTKDKEAKE